jgi:hypothetical protein
MPDQAKKTTIEIDPADLDLALFLTQKIAEEEEKIARCRGEIQQIEARRQHFLGSVAKKNGLAVGNPQLPLNIDLPSKSMTGYIEEETTPGDGDG